MVRATLEFPFPQTVAALEVIVTEVQCFYGGSLDDLRIEWGDKYLQIKIED